MYDSFLLKSSFIFDWKAFIFDWKVDQRCQFRNERNGNERNEDFL